MLMTLLLLITLALVFGVVMLGHWHWQHKTRQRVHALDLKPRSANPKSQNLPACVRRYLAAALPLDCAYHGVLLMHRGQFNLSERGRNWKAFQSRQWVVPQAAQFLWDAQIGILPGLKVFVHDALIGQYGLLHAQLGGWIPLAYQHDRSILAQGELLRFLAEAVWYPWALKPENGVSWTPISENKAEASLVLNATRASLIFEFGSGGWVQNVFCPDRPRLVKGNPQPTPWLGRFWDYRPINGLWLPHSGEVAWVIDGKQHPYWQGTLGSVAYFDRAEDCVGSGFAQGSKGSFNREDFKVRLTG